VTGETGRLIVDNPLAPHAGHALVVETAAGSRCEQVQGKSTYYHQLQHVVDALGGRTGPLLDGADAIGNMRVLDAIVEMAGLRSTPRKVGRKS
jgi:predicted dehydrogenase